MPDLIILAAEICQIKLKTRRNQWKFARIDVFGRVGFHGFSTSELETDPPASGFGNRDPWPTRGAVGSGERRSGTGGLGGLGGWAGGLDSPTRRAGTKRNDNFYFLSFSALFNLLWL